MIERLQAGPVVRAGGIAVVPILRFASALSAKHMAVGMIVPVAVVTIAGNETLAWRMDGRAAPPQQWLEAVPDLARLIDGIRSNPNAGPTGSAS